MVMGIFDVAVVIIGHLFVVSILGVWRISCPMFQLALNE